MLMMRLQRVGRKNDPSYRIVVVDKRASTNSNKTTDLIGSYNPKLGQITINADKAKDWISKGVQPSDTVYNMLVSKNIIEGKKRNALPKKTPIIDEAKVKAEAEAKEAKEAEAAAAKAETEAPVEEKVAEAVEETPAEKSDTPAEEEKVKEEATA
jgi:small subunit ribosomal protein S16